MGIENICSRAVEEELRHKKEKQDETQFTTTTTTKIARKISLSSSYFVL